jgi:CubicO group peptidase (beta-lactamase class C family)
MNMNLSLTHKVFSLTFNFLLTLGLILLGARTGKNNQPDLQAVDTFLQAQVEANRLPGLAVAIVQGDQVIFAKGYGEAAPGKPITPQTQFYIGSVTKSFTALAALKLVEQGKLDLDAPVQKYLPWFQVADPEASSKITVRNLLNHTSGLSEKGDPDAAAYTDSLEAQARLLKNVRLTAPVGSQYQYYNQNYRLVGLLIETVSGQTYGDYLRENVFAPLGMTRSAANPSDAPDLAQGHSRFFGFALPQSQRFIPGALPSGYLITTADDMARYLLAQLNNRQADGSPLLNPETLATMRTPPAGVEGNYGMGWMVMENSNTLVHGGALENFQSFVALGLKERIGLVVLYNKNSMENMLFENDTIRSGLLDLLNNKTPKQTSYGWIGWALLALAVADLLNHARLYWMLPRWTQKTAKQPRLWLWVKVLVGIAFPAVVIFGLPPLVNAIEGGAPNWIEPFRLMPDLTVWLLAGMGLNLLRSLLHALTLIRRPRLIEQ